MNLHPGGLINQRPLSVSNNPMHHHTEEEEIILTHTSGKQPGTITNHKSAINPSNIIIKVRQSTDNIQKSMEDLFKITKYSKKKDNRSKRHKDQSNQQCYSFTRINSTKIIHILIDNIAGMGIRTKKSRQIINYMEENQFDILLAQEANVDFKHKETRTYIERTLENKYHITVSETPFRATTVNKPGRTFVITSTPLKSRITNKISDEAGRWAGNVIILKNSQKVALISTYQTVKYQSPGITSINAQQTAWLASNNRLIDPITGNQTT
jgi:hypothetical protein